MTVQELNHPAVALVGILVAGLWMAFGYLIKYKGMVSLIAGYDEDLLKDKVGFQNWVGSTFIFVGLSWMVLSVFSIIFQSTIAYVFFVCMIFQFVGLAVAIFGTKRFRY